MLRKTPLAALWEGGGHWELRVGLGSRDDEIRTEARTRRNTLRGRGAWAGRWPHPGNEVLLQLLHQEVRGLLLVGLVGLQVSPRLLSAGARGHAGQLG